MENKTTGQLNEKVWYRLIKVIYFLVLFSILGIELDYSFSIGGYGLDLYTVQSIITTLIIFEVLRRVFYYIVLGTINPKK